MLDSDLIAFVRRSLRSIWALEILLLLQSRAPAELSEAEIVHELRATRQLVRRVLTQLAQHHLVSHEKDRIQFLPASDELKQLCESLRLASRERPIALRDAILQAPDDSLRNLADAFRFSDRRNEGDKQ